MLDTLCSLRQFPLSKFVVSPNLAMLDQHLASCKASVTVD